MQQDEVKELLGTSEAPCVSIFLPTHRAGRDTEKDPIRLKNLLNKAADAIGDRKLSDCILAPARKLLEPGTHFWRNTDLGLAIFLSPTDSRIIKLPVRLDEGVHVGDEFHIRPVLTMFDVEKHFFIIALEQENPRLYRATPSDIEPVKEPSWHESLEEFVGKTDFAADIGFHPSGPASATGENVAAKYHALGDSPEDYRQVELDRMMLSVAKAVAGFLNDRRLPLVAVGEPNLLGQFRKHNKYNHLLDKAVSRNPSHLDDQDIHKAAYDVVLETVGRPGQEARELFAESPPERMGRTPEDIVLGALDGRVSHLLLAEDADLRGRVDPEGRKVVLSREAGRDGDDLIDKIAKATLRKGGRVFVYDPVDMPDELKIAAVFRY